MNILAIETAANCCSVAVVKSGSVVASEAIAMERGHAEALMPMLDNAISSAHIDFNAFNKIAVSIGPGSFTGVRVGLSAARGLALASGVPVVGISTLQAVVGALPPEKRTSYAQIIVVIDTKRDDFYTQTFSPDLTPLSEPMVADGNAVKAMLTEQTLVVGDGAHFFRDCGVATDDIMPNAETIAHMAQSRNPENGFPLPLYIRPPDVSCSKS